MSQTTSDISPQNVTFSGGGTKPFPSKQLQLPLSSCPICVQFGWQKAKTKVPVNLLFWSSLEKEKVWADAHFAALQNIQRGVNNAIAHFLQKQQQQQYEVEVEKGKMLDGIWIMLKVAKYASPNLIRFQT